MKTRIAWVDSFRALMILCIVFGHAIPDGLLNRYVFFHVAAFFFISGYLFLPKAESFNTFFRRKFKTLMIPYYCFSVISILVFFFFGRIASSRISISIENTSLMPNIIGMLYANGNTGLMKWNLPLWFLPCLFSTLLIMFGIDRCSRMNLTTGAPCILLIVSLLAFLACSFVNYYCLRIGLLPFGFENTIYLMPFMLFGVYWRHIEPRFTPLSSRKQLFIGITLVTIGCTLAWGFNERVNYVNIHYGNLAVFYSSTIFAIIGFVMLSQRLSFKAFRYIGQNTIPILLMHKFPAVFMQILLSHYLTESVFGIFLALAITLFSVSSSLLVGKIIKRLAPWALGARHN